LQHATTVEQLLGRIVPFDEAAMALVQGFADALGWSISRGDLTPEERSSSAELEAAVDLQADLPVPREAMSTGGPR
jgi:hypothetical protein